MNTLFFTAGPSQLHSNYKKYYIEALDLNIGSINHRSKEFHTIYEFTDNQLRQLLNLTSQNQIYFTGSATEIWERLILNLVESNSFHLVNGSFSQRFFEISQLLGKNATAHFAQHGKGFELNEINILIETELICTTQNETSSGVFLPSSFLHEIKKKNANALLCTDIVSIAPISSLDYSIIDSSFFSVQKAFGMPPGLGVWIVNEKCIEKATTLEEKKINQGATNRVISYAKNYANWETPSTPNVMAIYILGKIAEEMNQKGLSTIQNEIKTKAKMIYDFAKASDKFDIIVKDEKFQSESVIVLACKNDNSELLSFLKSNGMHISSGYGTYKKSEIRIANFPTTTIEDVEKLIEMINKF